VLAQAARKAVVLSSTNGLNFAPQFGRNAVVEQQQSVGMRTAAASTSGGTWLGVTLMLLVAGIAALPLDLAVSRWCLDLKCPRAIHELFVNTEPFAHGIGVALIVAAIFVLDPRRRWSLPRLVILIAGAGLAANVVKLAVSRTRPNAFDFDGGVLATFNGLLPLGAGGGAVQSIPSAHAATAVAFAVGLTWIYPRGRWYFAALAALALLHRVEIGVHYLSDVCWGASLGWFVAAGVIQRRFTPASFNRWERRAASAGENLTSGRADRGSEPEITSPPAPPIQNEVRAA
jgi:membrane-associated phospholipid phosphatase